MFFVFFIAFHAEKLTVLTIIVPLLLFKYKFFFVGNKVANKMIDFIICILLFPQFSTKCIHCRHTRRKFTNMEPEISEKSPRNFGENKSLSD